MKQRTVKLDDDVNKMIGVICNHLGITQHSYMKNIISQQTQSDMEKYNLECSPEKFLIDDICTKSGWYSEIEYDAFYPLHNAETREFFNIRKEQAQEMIDSYPGAEVIIKDSNVNDEIISSKATGDCRYIEKKQKFSEVFMERAKKTQSKHFFINVNIEFQ